MADDAPTSATLLLTYAIDDIAECTQLIRFGPSDRRVNRPWWRALVMGVFRTRAETMAEQRLMYLTENVERARDRWREVLLTVQHMEEAGRDDEVLRRLAVELRNGGIDDVAHQLRRSELANEVQKVIAHLEGVADQMVVCKGMMVKARNLLSLQKLREGDG